LIFGDTSDAYSIWDITGKGSIKRVGKKKDI